MCSQKNYTQLMIEFVNTKKLPKTWRLVVTTITKAKNFTTLKLKYLHGSLRAHEAILQVDKLVKKDNMIALKLS